MTLGSRVRWQSCGRGELESVVVALASNIIDHTPVAAVAVHWGLMWIATESLTVIGEPVE